MRTVGFIVGAAFSLLASTGIALADPPGSKCKSEATLSVQGSSEKVVVSRCPVEGASMMCFKLAFTGCEGNLVVEKLARPITSTTGEIAGSHILCNGMEIGLIVGNDAKLMYRDRIDISAKGEDEDVPLATQYKASFLGGLLRVSPVVAK